MLGADSTYIEEVGGNFENLQGVMPVDGGQYDIPQLIQQAESQGFPEVVKRLKRIFGTEKSEQFKASPIPRLTLESSYPKFLILYAFDMYGQRQTFTKDQAHLLKDAVIRVNGSADVFEGADKDHLTILKDIGVEGEPVTGVVASFLGINKK